MYRTAGGKYADLEDGHDHNTAPLIPTTRGVPPKMLRWFSIRRLLLWLSLSAGLLFSLVWLGKMLNLHVGRRRSTLLMERKAPDKYGDFSKPSKKIENPSKQKKTAPVGKGKKSDATRPKPLIESALPPLINLTIGSEAPFKMSHEDIKNEFQKYVSDGNKDMDNYLWKEWMVRALPETLHGKHLKAEDRFQRSLIRHVSLFYGEYLLKGGKEPRRFNIPVCSTIGFSNHNDEYEDAGLDALVGSQGTLHFKEINYAPDKTTKEAFPFMLTADGKVKMVAKYFSVNHGKKDKPSEHDGKVPSRENGAAQEAARIFGKEHFALSSIHSPHVLQPICYEKQPSPKMIYPYISGGDLVTLSTDHLAYYSPKKPNTLLNPDETFLPRFFRQLVQAVYDVHSAGLIHLDLKPENFVIFGPDRNFVRPLDSLSLQRYSLVLLDFGLATRLIDAKKRSCIKAGTDVTMSPEQTMCNDRAGRGTDWWGVGASMWRTRVFWEPSISEERRSELLKLRDPQWGHPILPAQPFFSPEFNDLLSMLLTPRPKSRDFSKSPSHLLRLLDSPYLLKGLEPAERIKRLKLIAENPPVYGKMSDKEGDRSHDDDLAAADEDGDDVKSVA